MTSSAMHILHFHWGNVKYLELVFEMQQTLATVLQKCAASKFVQPIRGTGVIEVIDINDAYKRT